MATKTTKLPFAAKAQRINIVLLIVALAMLAQKFTYEIYAWGFRLLMITVPLQVALGNINPEWDSKKTVKKTIWILIVTVIIFVFSIVVTPYLIELGRATKKY